jgi:hypothetical protein
MGARGVGVLWVALVLGLAGCATTSGTQGATPFTTADQLKKLTAGPKPERVFTTRTADSTQWTLLGPFPEELSLAPHEQQSPAGKAIVAEASKRGAAATSALACAARELAHFVAVQQEQPPRLLRDAIAGRCAVGTTVMASNWMEVDVGDATDEAIVAMALPKLSKALETVGPNHFVGAAFSRSGTKGVLMLVQVEAHGTLEPVSLFPGADGAVTLRGTTPAGVVELAGVVTRGDVGAAMCVDLHLRALPQYDLRCPVEATDSTAWISVATRAQGRLLSQELQRLLVLPSRTPSTSWTLPQIVPAGIAPTVEAVTAQVNALRVGAGLRALELSASQSADLHEVAPFLFQAVATDDTATADQLALGIIAGWHVEKDVTWGNFSAEVSEHDDGSLLLTHALLSPSTRAMLFDPKATLLGLGLHQETGGLGAVFSVYHGLEMAPFPATAAALVQQLDAARAKLSRQPVKWLRLPVTVESGLAGAITAHKLELPDAFSRFLDATVAATTRGAQGFTLETGSLEQVPWPAELLNAESLEISMVVAPVRAPRAPWAHFVMMIARPEPQ